MSSVVVQAYTYTSFLYYDFSLYFSFENSCKVGSGGQIQNAIKRTRTKKTHRQGIQPDSSCRITH